jgi:hypothetical protein
MYDSKLLGLAFMVILALASITVATASAETLPNVLPLSTAEKPGTFTYSSSAAAFGTAGLTEVTSPSSLGESTSEGTEGNAGSSHDAYFGVKNALLGNCTGTGDGVGIVLVLGRYEERDADLAGKLIVAVVFLLDQVQFECGTTMVTTAGCVAGNLTPLSELTTLLTDTFNRVGNDNEITSYLSSTGLPEFCLFLAKIGSGATELATQSQTTLISNFKGGGTAIEVLVMPL